MDPALTTALLASYGRLDDLVYYATLRQVRVISSSHTERQLLDPFKYNLLQ